MMMITYWYPTGYNIRPFDESSDSTPSFWICREPGKVREENLWVSAHEAQSDIFHLLMKKHNLQSTVKCLSDNLTNGHVYGFWLKACEELSPKIDPLKVHIHAPRDFKPSPWHHLKGFSEAYINTTQKTSRYEVCKLNKKWIYLWTIIYKYNLTKQ